MSERMTNTAQAARAGSSRHQSSAGPSARGQDEPLRGGEVAAICAHHCDSLKTEMRTYVEHELRALRLQQSEDVARFSNLTQGLVKKMENLEAKAGSLREEVSALRQDVTDLLETRSTLCQEMDTRFSRVANRLNKLENHR